MATESLSYHFNLSPEAADRFADAIDGQENRREERRKHPVECPGKILTEPGEVEEFMQRLFRHV